VLVFHVFAQVRKRSFAARADPILNSIPKPRVQTTRGGKLAGDLFCSLLISFAYLLLGGELPA